MKRAFKIIGILMFTLILLFVSYTLGFNEGLKEAGTKAYKVKSKLNSDILWNSIQKWRISNNLKPYIKDQRLCDVAKDRVLDGLDYHNGFTKKLENGYYKQLPKDIGLQENSVWDVPNEEAALDSWLNSTEHKKTLLRPYTHSCVATNDSNALQIFSNL